MLDKDNMKFDELSQTLLEVKNALESVDYGGVEIIIQDGIVTQISTRQIKKTNFKKKNLTDGVYHSTQGIKNGESSKIS